MTIEYKDVLYKKDSKGKIRIWSMELDGDRYRTAAGSADGKIVVSNYTTAQPKNVGRANETTAEQQAALEVEAEYTKKLKTGYHRNKDDVDNAGYVKPMLAEKWDDRIIIGHQRIFVQPKFDGFRCVATKDGLFSRKGERFTAAPHIVAALTPVFAKHPNLVLDGELYNHEFKDDFNKIASLVRKQNPNEAQLEETKRYVQYHVYDMVDTSKSFADRGTFLANEVFSFDMGIDLCIKAVDTYEVETKEAMDELYGKFLEEGYEGQMVRLNGHYQNKRSKYLMKRKEFQDNEYEIVAIEEGLGNRSGMAGRVTLKLGDGTDKTFGAGIKGGVEYNKFLWNNRQTIVGKKGTVEFFQLTPDGIPRFPVFKAVREDI